MKGISSVMKRVAIGRRIMILLFSVGAALIGSNGFASAAGDDSYKAGYKEITFIIKVK